MKSIIILPLLILAIAAGTAAHGEPQQPQENVAPQDSTIDVIAWFNRHDTVTYWVNESVWKISGTDTVRTASAAMKVRINVVDSTANGYKMDYTFLEFPTDTLPDSASDIERFQNQITAKLGSKIAGTTVHFETDEYGRITKYNNLGQIKKQAKSLFKEAINDYSKLPELQALKKIGLDIKDYAKNVDTDELVDSYLEELEMLFVNHGQSVRIGEFSEHEDATESSFENTLFCSAYMDSDDGSYHILYDVTNILPQTEVKNFVGALVKELSDDSISDNFNENFDKQVKEDAIYEDYLRISYLINGWPYSVVRQKSTIIGSQQKVKQAVITLDSYSFGL